MGTTTVAIPPIATDITRLTAMGTTGLGITAPGTSTFGLGTIVPAATIIAIAVIGDCDTFWVSADNIGDHQRTDS